LAEDIIDKMSGEFQPDKFEDRYENAMIELIQRTDILPHELPTIVLDRVPEGRGCLKRARSRTRQ
jgi:hypothetical protein